MVMFCNDAILQKNGIAVPTTWDEFAASAAKLHQADPNAYLSNFTADQGWFFGILWQSGARPFAVDGENVAINFTSPEATRVAKLWGDLIKSGNLSPVDTYTNDWNTALGNGSVAAGIPEHGEPLSPLPRQISRASGRFTRCRSGLPAERLMATMVDPQLQ